MNTDRDESGQRSILDHSCTMPADLRPPPREVSVEELNLPVRVYNLLKRADVHSAGEALDLGPAGLRELGLTGEDVDLVRRGLGEVGLGEALADGEWAEA